MLGGAQQQQRRRGHRAELVERQIARPAGQFDQVEEADVVEALLAQQLRAEPGRPVLAGGGLAGDLGLLPEHIGESGQQPRHLGAGVGALVGEEGLLDAQAQNRLVFRLGRVGLGRDHTQQGIGGFGIAHLDQLGDPQGDQRRRTGRRGALGRLGLRDQQPALQVAQGGGGDRAGQALEQDGGDVARRARPELGGERIAGRRAGAEHVGIDRAQRCDLDRIAARAAASRRSSAAASAPGRERGAAGRGRGCKPVGRGLRRRAGRAEPQRRADRRLLRLRR
ncbi:MAG: hypothetical protein WDO24_31295 [Pseudomonadota bacterium]